MRKIIVLIIAFFVFISVNVSAVDAGNAIVSWTAPTTNIDGSPAVVVGYKIYYGTVTKTYTLNKDVGNVLTYTITNLPVGNWFFAVKAYNAGGESDYSNEATKFITQPVSGAPIGCTVK